MFLALLAHACRKGWIEVHAFVVMGTHFHLLIRSPHGLMSQAMQWIQQRYAVYFNRSRRRTDSVFGKRFFSKEVRSDAYWIAVVRYIDLNPVQAGLAVDPATYPFGSARYYCAERAPLWLCRDEVDMFLNGNRPADGGSYRRLWEDKLSDRDVTRLVERRMELANGEYDPLSDLIRGSDGAALAWVKRMARNADGVPPATAILAPERALEALDARCFEIDLLELPSGHHPLSTIFRAGILRTACGESLNSLTLRLGIPRSTLSRLLQHHTRLVQESEIYARHFADHLADRLEGAFPTRRR